MNFLPLAGARALTAAQPANQVAAIRVNRSGAIVMVREPRTSPLRTTGSTLPPDENCQYGIPACTRSADYCRFRNAFRYLNFGHLPEPSQITPAKGHPVISYPLRSPNGFGQNRRGTIRPDPRRDNQRLQSCRTCVFECVRALLAI